MLKISVVFALLTSNLIGVVNNVNDKSENNNSSMYSKYVQILNDKKLKSVITNEVNSTNNDEFEIISKYSISPKVEIIDKNEATGEAILYNYTDDLYVYADKIDENSVLLNSNYTGYAGATNTYYHSVRPDYAGQNCLACS